MFVVATAGHVDHGKSALVHALTGMDPDRWAEEKRRGLTIDLGFAWTALPSGAEVALVDVPGHERFVGNMLAGVGPVPAVMVVVAADEGWMPQTEEHVRALRALGVRHGLLVVSKADRADPTPVLADALPRLEFLDQLHVVRTSTVTGEGIEELAASLDKLGAPRPRPDPRAPVRLWIDRVFTISGAGTVVTGTLPAGRLAVGDQLQCEPGGRLVSVRGLESRQQSRDSVTGTARVAVNVRGVDRAALHRGMALVTPDAWSPVTQLDVVVDGDIAEQAATHIGAAAVPTRVRPLAPGAARLTLSTALPLHVGDKLLLREPASRCVVGAVVADLHPRSVVRRGEAAKIGRALRVPSTADDEVRRQTVVTAGELRRAGLRDEPTDAISCGGYWVSRQSWQQWADDLRTLAEQIDATSPALSLAAAGQAIDAPMDDIVVALVDADDRLQLRDGRISRVGCAVTDVPELRDLLDRLAEDPLAAPTGEDVRSIGRAALAQGTRAGLLLHLGGGVYVAPDAVSRSLEVLRQLDQPFPVSAAREALGSSRRVVVPLLEHLDAARLTRADRDGRRVVTGGERSKGLASKS